MKMSKTKMTILAVLVSAILTPLVLTFTDAPGVRFLREFTRGEIVEEEGPTIFVGTKFEKLALAARAIKTRCDMESVLGLVSKYMDTTGPDPDFILMENIIANRVAKVVTKNDLDRMSDFAYAAELCSTRNLLVIKFLETGKLGDSKQSLLEASKWLWFVKPAPNGYQRRVPEVKKALLDAAIAQKDSRGALTRCEAWSLARKLELSEDERGRFLKNLGF